MQHKHETEKIHMVFTTSLSTMYVIFFNIYMNLQDIALQSLPSHQNCMFHATDAQNITKFSAKLPRSILHRAQTVFDAQMSSLLVD